MNACCVCGGGLNSYTAPEARCRCYVKDQKKIDSLAHEILVAESRWLSACGWTPTDITSKAEGFVWVDEKRDGPFTHEQAVKMQRQRDADPIAKRQFELEVRHIKVFERRESKTKKGQDISAESGELVEIINMMTSLQTNKNQKSG